MGVIADTAAPARQPSEPHFAQARKDVMLLANADSAIAPLFISGVYFAASAWVDAHPELTRRVSQAIRESAHWANTHHAQTAAVLAQNAGLDAATIATMTRSTFAESLTAPEIQPAVDVAFNYGRLKERLDMRTIVAKAAPYWNK